MQPIRIMSLDILERESSTMAHTAELNPRSTHEQLKDAVEASAQGTTKERKNGNKPRFAKECRDLKRTALEKLETREYQGPRRAYKDAARRKRIEYELKQFGEKVNASKSKPWILLPKEKPATIAKVDLEAFKEYFGKLYGDQEHRTEFEPEYRPRANDCEWYNGYIGNEGRSKRELEEHTLFRSMKKRKRNDQSATLRLKI